MGNEVHPKNYKYFISSIVDNVIPKTIANAQCVPKQVEVMKEEMAALVRNNTWDVVNIPERAYLVGCK